MAAKPCPALPLRFTIGQMVILNLHNKLFGSGPSFRARVRRNSALWLEMVVLKLHRHFTPRSDPWLTASDQPGTMDVINPADRLTPTIFYEAWWLAIVSEGGAYKEATVSSDGNIIGRLPYFLSRKFGGQVTVTMPEMTHVLGPALAAGTTACDSARSLKQFTITSSLIAQLPKAADIWTATQPAARDGPEFNTDGLNSKTNLLLLTRFGGMN